MSKREYVREIYARNLHRAHHRRATAPFSRVLIPWEDLTDRCRQEYLDVAATIQDALERHPDSRPAQLDYLVDTYDMADYGQRGRDYWESRIRECIHGHTT